MATKVLPLWLLFLCSLALHRAGFAVHFELGIPDLIATKHTKDGDVTVKGYRAVTNEALLATNRTDIAPQLLWATVGDPRIIKSAPANTKGDGNVSTKVFHFTDSGFYMMMQMKTAEDSELLAKRAVLKYGLPVTPSQVRHLLLSKLTCVLDLRDTGRRSVRIVGRPASLRNFPLRVEFPAPPGSESRSLFEKRLADDPDMSVPCSICLSSASEDTPPDQAGGDNATNVTESSVLPVPPDTGGGGGGAGPDDDCRRRLPSAETVASELTSLSANLSGLACDAARLGAETPALTAALEQARAACARLSPTSGLQMAAAVVAAAARLSGPELRQRLALRVVYDLRSGRTHNLLDSRRLRARASGPGVLGPDGARFRPSRGGGGVLRVDDVSDELFDLLDAGAGWTFFAKLKLNSEQPDGPPQPLLTFWDPAGSRAVWQLSVGPRQVVTALTEVRGGVGVGGGGFASTAAALLPGSWHRVAAAQAAPAAVVHAVDGAALPVTEAPSVVATVADFADLLTDRRRLWLGEVPGGGGGGGGFNGVVGCFGAAAVALTPVELEAVFAAFCD